MGRIISNTDKVIDSRDVIARIEELEDERQELADAVESANAEVEQYTLDRMEAEHPDNFTALVEETKEILQTAKDDLAAWDAEYADELAAIKKFAEEGEQAALDWHYGETCIHESYFVDYCQEMLQDCGDLPKNIPAYLVIDWDATAENLKVDYTTIEWNGETYYVR